VSCYVGESKAERSTPRLSKLSLIRMIYGRRKTPSRKHPRRNQYRITSISFGKGSIPLDTFTMQHESVRRTDSEMKTFFKLEGQSELQVFILQAELEDRRRIEHDLVKKCGHRLSVCGVYTLRKHERKAAAMPCTNLTTIL
jgi:hypothetical protein